MRMVTKDLITRDECLNFKEASSYIESNELRFYVYFLIDPFTFQIKYVGKGSGNRFKHHWNDLSKNSRKQSWLNKLRRKETTYLVSVWEFYENENVAYEQESNFIHSLGRYKIDNKGTLLNVQHESDKHLQHSNKWRDTKGFIKEAKIIHGDKFDYSEVVYKRADEKVDIICNKCKELFSQLAISHLSGSGCLNCVGPNNKKKFSKTSSQFKEEAELKFPKLFDYKLSEYKGAKEIIKIWCIKCQKFIYPEASSFLHSKYGCKSCSMSNNSNRWKNVQS